MEEASANSLHRFSNQTPGQLHNFDNGQGKTRSIKFPLSKLKLYPNGDTERTVEPFFRFFGNFLAKAIGLWIKQTLQAFH